MSFTDSNPNLFKKVTKDLKGIDKQLYKIAAGVRKEIKARTLSGKDADDNVFKEYNEQYRDYKISRHRSGKVNLSFFGEMLRSMRLAKIQGGAKIHFESAGENDKAVWNEDKGRVFFAISKKQEDDVLKKVNKAINNGK